MRKEIEEYVRECRICQQKRTFKETRMEHEIERNLEV